MKGVLMLCAIVLAVGSCVADDVSAGSVARDWSYGAYPVVSNGRDWPGVTRAVSSTLWVVPQHAVTRQPDWPWLTVRINGRNTALGSVTAVIEGEMMLPVMAAPYFGLTPTASAASHHELTLRRGDQVAKLTVGSHEAEVNGVAQRLAVMPRWHNGLVYVPLITICKLLGWQVDYDTKTGVLSVVTR